MGISKTDFIRGMQCRKMLWLDKHKRELRVIPPETQERMNAGTDFGIRARSMFGEYEDMTVYKPDSSFPDPDAMVAKTKQHLKIGTRVLCEAAFSDYNNYCAVDILRKTDDGYEIYEVKESSGVYEQLIKDAGFQYYILSRCRIKIDKVCIVTHGEDEDDHFVINDVTDRAKSYYKWINDNIWDLNRIRKSDTEYAVEPGEQCEIPYRCWYYDYCHNVQNNEVL